MQSPEEVEEEFPDEADKVEQRPKKRRTRFLNKVGPAAGFKQEDGLTSGAD